MELQRGAKIVANAGAQSTNILYTGNKCVKKVGLRHQKHS